MNLQIPNFGQTVEAPPEEFIPADVEDYQEPDILPPEVTDESLDTFNLQELNNLLEQIHTNTPIAQAVNDSIKAEMQALRNRLNELVDKQSHINFKITQAKRVAEKAALKRERLLQEQMANEAIAETAEKIMELLKDFPTWEKLYDFQKEDVTAAIHAYLSGYSGFLNANDMGMGKTLESIVTIKVLTMLMESDLGRPPRLLWFTKSNILKTGGTVREFDMWYEDFKIAPLDGSKPKAEREAFFKLIDMIPGMGVITNYEAARTTEKLGDIEWDIIVMDEVHKLKGGANPSGPTGLWTACKEIATKPNVKMLLMLSGTPMVNRPAEMWAYLNIFDEDRFPNMRQFEREYTMVVTLGWEQKIEINAQKLLQTALKGRMIRRTKKEVGLQLPEITPYKQRERLLVRNPEQDRVYQQMRDQFYIWLEEQDPDTTFSSLALIAQLIRLRQINIWPVIKFTEKDPITGEISEKWLRVEDSSKIDEAMEDIQQVCSDGEQFVLFCTFNEPLKEIQRRCQLEGISCELLTGENSKGLTSMETDFQQGKTQVLCINSAMGEGLNLQKNPDRWPGGSSYVAFLDLWYNPARNDQCTDRVYRPGATEPVTVIHYKNEESVDQWLDMMIEEKYQSITGISEDKALRPSEWKELLKGKI